MALRTAKKGRNPGEQFWGCTKFPRCRGTRNVRDESEPAEPFRDTRVSPDTLLPVEWIEGVRRADFIPEYVSVGAVPGILQDRLGDDARLTRALSQCVLLSRRSRERGEGVEHVRFATTLLIKLLRRGHTPLATLDVEREGLRTHGLLDRVSEIDEDGTDVGWAPQPGTPLRLTDEVVLSKLTEKVPFILDPAFDFDPGSDESLLQSQAEAWFLNQWVPTALGPTSGHWFTPQAPLDRLVESAGEYGSGARRVDFLFSHPGGSPFAIEIDGPEHEGSVEVDKARDESLRSIGIDVLRITNAEVQNGRGAMLEKIRGRCQRVLTAFARATGEERAVASLAVECANAARVQFVVARAMAYGWLTPGESWEIDIRGSGSPAAAGVLDVLRLLAGIDILYGGCSVPTGCTVRADNGFVRTWMRAGGGRWVTTTVFDAPVDRLAIAVESTTSPFHRVSGEGLDFVIRPVYVPALIAAGQSFDLRRRAAVVTTYEEARAPLRMFLRNIFRKRDFRPMQGQAIFNVLRQNDSVVLLQTGGGKSIIYQLAGLLMPGVTLVVDPITALIEDQVEGLRSYGIDRAASITSQFADREERERLLRRVERGEYLFVLHAPERLQSPQFRTALRALVECAFINLAVVDEAHCVSEWGHDFRPAYLNLANNLRRLGADREFRPPPLLALTGTASRAVLRDMLADLGIDRNRSDALIRPESFDRSEIRFEIVRTSPVQEPSAALRGVMNALPGKFGLPRAEFYRSSGAETASGIVFVPTVKARTYGVQDARRIVQQATGADVTIYSGNPPASLDADKWHAQKRENAADFKANRVPVLVATKAFGMGIDKPNIRYTVHFGMPMSLESFYQEAGRAGRDRKLARATVVFSEYDPGRSGELIDPDLDLEALRSRFEEIEGNRQTADDLTRALWFHLQAFSGAAREIDNVSDLLNALGDLSSRKRIERPYGDGHNRLREEKAVYRLLRLGVIDDYEVDFGSGRFVIHVDAFDFNRCKERLLEYVRSAQPGKSKSLVRSVNNIDTGRPRDAALALVTLLIEFTYDLVERSRRGMIREALLLARQARDDAEIRVRLLDYLQEGFGAEHIERLLQSENVELAAWWDLVSKVQSAMDAGELRGLCIRALESDPDHPGLLLARALSESMCSDHDESVSSRGIGAAIRIGVEKYEISQVDIEASIDEMYDLASTRAQDLGPPLTLALLDLADTSPGFEYVETRAFQRAVELDDPRVGAVIASRRLGRLVGRLNRTADRVTGQLEAPGVAKALGA